MRISYRVCDFYIKLIRSENKLFSLPIGVCIGMGNPRVPKKAQTKTKKN